MGFAAKNHSWSIVAQNISRELIKIGHRVDIFSTNGTEYFPEDLKSNLIGHVNEGDDKVFGRNPDDKYDMQLSYTALRNFPAYFSRGDSNRFGIWNYETTVLPKAFAKYVKYVDKLVPSSNFSKKIFVDNGIPESNQVVIPHGIHLERFQNLGKYPLKTNAKLKFLANIAQPHLRKNIPGLLKAWGKAFTRLDNVCLVLKISKKGPNPMFDIPFTQVFNEFKSEFKNHAEIEIIDTFIPNIEPLYNACDVVFTMSHSECFWMPGLEGLAANKLIISPRYGGQLDFLNDNNSILIDGKLIRANNNMQYWEPSPYAAVFDPDVNQAAQKLKDVYHHYDDYIKKFSPLMQEIVSNYSWTKVAQQFIDLAK